MVAELDRFDRILAFLQEAQGLKDTLRSSNTNGGARESVAAHSWGLCLLVLLVECDLGDIDIARLLKLCILHDLGEVISGDVPATAQVEGDGKAERERADFATLTSSLPDDLRVEFRVLWEEYEAGESREAVLAKGLDKIETMIQHVGGAQPAGFDYLWNLGYGVERTDKSHFLRQLRRKVDALTRAADARYNSGGSPGNG